MRTSTDDIQTTYQNRLAAMTPAERVARSMAMFQWTREQLARQILAEQGPTHPSRLKWLVALRLYGSEPQVKAMIESKLADVSD